MLKEQTVLRVINKHLEFTCTTDYTCTNFLDGEILTIENLRDIAKSNMKHWEPFHSDESENPFYMYWATLYQKINDGLSECRECKSKTQEDKRQLIDTLLVSIQQSRISYSSDLDSMITRSIAFEAPVDRDPNFPRYVEFFKDYFKNLKNHDLNNATKKYINLIKAPSALAKCLTSSYDSYAQVGIYFLQEEILGNKHDWDRIAQSTADIYQRSLSSKEKALNASFEGTREALNELDEKAETRYQEIDETIKAAEERLRILEETYKEKLKLEEPEKLWRERAEVYRKRVRKFSLASLGCGVILVSLIGVLLHHLTTFKTLAVSWLSPTIVLIAVISFGIYLTQVLIKITNSNQHLQIACEEKAAMTRFYQALIYDGKEISDEERILIFKELFKTTDSGLVKVSDDGGTLISVLNLLSKK